MRNKINKYLLLIVIPIIVFCGYVYTLMFAESTDNAYIDGDISLISPQASGVIEKIYCMDNEKVNKGQLLAQIKEEDYKIKEMQAKSAIAIVNFELELKKQNINLQKIEIKKIESALKSAGVDSVAAENNFKRIIELKKDNFSSNKSLDATKSDLEKAKFNLEKTILDLQSAKTKLLSLELEKEITLANLAKTQYVYDEMALKLKNTKIISPVDGIIANNNLKLGNFVKEGMPVLTIVNTKNIYLKANFKENQTAKIIPGMKAEIFIDSFPKIKILGQVRSVYPATSAKFSLIPSDNATGNFTKVVQRIPVLIDFIVPKELEDKVSVGMSTYVKVYLK